MILTYLLVTPTTSVHVTYTVQTTPTPTTHTGNIINMCS